MSEAQAQSKRPVLKMVKQQAKEQADEWPPLKAGLFNGSYKRFIKIAEGLEEALRISILLK